MTWFYVSNGQQAGPVDDAQLAELTRSGAVGADTLVWKEGMADWRPYRTVAPAPGPPPITPLAPPLPAADLGAQQTCSQCGQIFPVSQLVSIGGALTCAGCKPVALQRLQQGTWTSGNRRYAGFWIRFVALIIDGLILSAAGAIITIPLGLGIATDGSVESIAAIIGMFGASSAINTLLAVGYYTYFLSQHGATPGKMVFGLQVIRSDGSRLTPGRAAGRYFATLLSAIVMGIGYIIAAFDPEKRTLHDHICDTRVVYKS